MAIASEAAEKRAPISAEDGDAAYSSDEILIAAIRDPDKRRAILEILDAPER